MRQERYEREVEKVTVVSKERDGAIASVQEGRLALRVLESSHSAEVQRLQAEAASKDEQLQVCRRCLEQCKPCRRQRKSCHGQYTLCDISSKNAHRAMIFGEGHDADVTQLVETWILADS